MSVEFNEDMEYTSSRPIVQKKPSLLTRFTYATGLAHDEAGAQKVLLIIAILLFVITGLLFFFATKNPLTIQIVHSDINDSAYQQLLLSGGKK